MQSNSVPTTPAVPEWLETPEHEECEYLLVFEDANGCQDHSVDVTREEFEALKRHLANMRGYRVEADGTATKSEGTGAPEWAETSAPLNATGNLVVDRLESVIAILENQIMWARKDPARLTAENAADALLLDEVIRTWDAGVGDLDKSELPIVRAYNYHVRQ
jgi:hypothetical protein